MKKEMYVHPGNGRNECSNNGLVNYDVLLKNNQVSYGADFSNWETGVLVCTFERCDWKLYNYTKNPDDITEERIMWTLNREAAINFAEQVVEAIKMMDEKYGKGNW